jgi:uncharacterized protein YndB with AHSA1/START domain
MTANASGTVRITRRFDVPIERVFDAWLDPTQAGKWLFATPTGQMVRAEIDARVGGSFVFTDRRDGEDVEHVGTYQEIDRPRRLVFSFAVPKYSTLVTRVSLALTPLPGGCELTLTQENTPSEWIDRAREGWDKIIAGLASHLAKESSFAVALEPGTLRLERLLPGPIERVWAYLTESDKRAQWLAAGEMEPRVGGSITLRFDHAKLSAHQAPPPERYKNTCATTSEQTVTRFEPPRLLAWTWDGGNEPPSEVTFELTPQGDKVLLVITHRRLASRDRELGVAVGWHAHLAMLIERLQGREPPAFWSVFSALDAEYARRFAAK